MIEKKSLLEETTSWEIAEDDEGVGESVELEQVDFFVQTMDVRSLIGRLEDEDLIIPNYQISRFSSEESDDNEILGFQRNFVWNNAQMDSLIESVLMEYPIPGIFLIEINNGKYLILDGQQRITTLASYKKGTRPESERIFKLDKVNQKFKGLTFEEMNSTAKRKFNNYPITCTIITAETINGRNRAVYQLFQRINSNGTKLMPHEIRVASYAGPLVGFIEKINSKNEDWRALYGNPEKRLRDHQLISRILALYINPDSYEKSVKGLIDNFYDSYFEMDSNSIDFVEIEDIFTKALSLLHEYVGGEAFAPYGNKNEAWIDSLMVGLMRAWYENQNEEYWKHNLSKKFTELKKVAKDPSADILAPRYSRRSADSQAVKERLQISEEVFSCDLRK